MYFGSDNFAGAHPLIAASLSEHAAGFATPYGASDLDKAIEDRFSEIFERPVSVFFVSTGTAANSLALASLAKPGGIVFAHREAHVIADECGAPEYFSNLLRIVPVDGRDGKMEISQLRRQLERVSAMDIHQGRPNTITVTQSNESGTVYSLEELDEIAAAAREYKLPLHMDGARFANALVALGCTPAEMTWKRGVEILSFGGTKNGCWCAEVVVLFDKEKASEFAWYHKRAAQLFSKSRFVAAQLDAYLRDDLWLKNARHANRMGALVAETVRGFKSVRLAREPQANEVFVVMPKVMATELENRGFVFLEWPPPEEMSIGSEETLCRFVTSFATTEEMVQGLGDAIRELS